MPRVGRAKVRRHAPAASLASAPAPAPVVPEPMVHDEQDIGASDEEQVEDAPKASSSKRPLSFKATLAKTAPHPYLTLSKSHIRREKRKAKSQLAGGMGTLSSALGDIADIDEDDDEIAPPSKKSTSIATNANETKTKPKMKKVEDKGKIGEGKGRTLGEKKRRAVIQDAAKRIPAVMAHPAYKQKPWATIREHVGNTLATKSK